MRATAPNWEMQLGSLGSGNHFIEVTADEKGQVWLFLHSGSRGVGNKIATHHIKVAQELIRPETAKRNRAEIERRMEVARAKLAQLGDSRVAARVPTNLRDVWPSLSLDRRRAILAAVIERIEIHPQGSGQRFDPEAIKVTWRD